MWCRAFNYEKTITYLAEPMIVPAKNHFAAMCSQKTCGYAKQLHY